ncbi:hypothetical protein [Sagittula sp. SSi028]|uniref:hypothetical protein n=1 Tax=Sagittula sp. SSi028 TaxID=3400636 RepID=UPI003AF8C3EF
MRPLPLLLGLLIAATPGLANPWELIVDIEYDETETETSWRVDKKIPEALRAQADGFTITGFYVPVEAQAKVSQFLIVPDPEDCPFCGSNGYGPTLEVHLAAPMNDVPEATKITVQGQLHFDESPETYRAVFLTEARLVANN